MRNKTTLAAVLLTLSTLVGLFLTADLAAAPIDLAKGFVSPPQSAKPWVYWFWLDGNITREGITADLEAMRRVGIGGVLIMEVDQGTPKGPARFASPQWRTLFEFMLAEANRLGLKVNMNNDAGWCGSGGPWITPALSMQKLVATNVSVTGPQVFDGTLPQPTALHDYYRDIKVLAFPAPVRGERASVPKEKILDLTDRMDKAGRLKWEAPAGR